MKEATGEVSGVVITIVIIAAVLAIGTAIFSSGTAQKWIENMFEDTLDVDNN